MGQRKKLLMVLDEAGRELQVMEDPEKSKPRFYSIQALQVAIHGKRTRGVVENDLMDWITHRQIEGDYREFLQQFPRWSLFSKNDFDPNPQLASYAFGEASTYRQTDSNGRAWVGGPYKPYAGVGIDMTSLVFRRFQFASAASDMIPELS